MERESLLYHECKQYTQTSEVKNGKLANMKTIKTHDRDFFYKYANYDTAINILSNLEVRWSSPLLFNDPFDTQLDIRYDFNPEELISSLPKEIEKVIFAEEEPQFADDNPLSLDIKRLRKIRHKLNAGEFITQMNPDIKKAINDLKKLLDDVNQSWKEYVRSMRVFCISEKYNDLLMWAHYAEQHTGVVLKLKCIPELDTALCAAREINYSSEIPVLATKEDYIKKFTAQINIDYGDLYKNLAYTKSDHWAYENEWRCIVFRPINDNLYDVNLLNPEEIDTIYLGCRMSKPKRNEILKLLTGKLKHVKVSIASISKTRFSLDFDDITKE